MLEEYIDFVKSLFPCISPYTQERAKECIRQFYILRSEFPCFTTLNIPDLNQGDIISQLPFRRYDAERAAPVKRNVIPHRREGGVGWRTARVAEAKYPKDRGLHVLCVTETWPMDTTDITNNISVTWNAKRCRLNRRSPAMTKHTPERVTRGPQFRCTHPGNTDCLSYYNGECLKLSPCHNLTEYAGRGKKKYPVKIKEHRK